jgi:hypothetical protein
VSKVVRMNERHRVHNGSGDKAYSCLFITVNWQDPYKQTLHVHKNNTLKKNLTSSNNQLYYQSINTMEVKYGNPKTCTCTG